MASREPHPGTSNPSEPMHTTTEQAAALAHIAEELVTIAASNWQGYDAWSSSETGILDGPRVRELGEQANRIGGFPAMQIACYAAFTDDSGHAVVGTVKSAALSEINWQWNGIGDWQA